MFEIFAKYKDLFLFDLSLRAIGVTLALLWMFVYFRLQRKKKDE